MANAPLKPKPKRNDKYVIYVNNPPKFNQKKKKYYMNFNNKVTVSSVKNFQVIHQPETSKNE